MLSKNDFQMLRQMFGEMLRENNGIFGRELKREMRDEIYSVVNAAVFASETRMIARMDSMKEEIVDGITDILDDSVYPRLYTLEQQMGQVKHHLKLA